jgi:hypothetical protein
MNRLPFTAHRQHVFGALLALLPLCGVACAHDDGRPPVYPAHGQVLWEGKPLPGALVLLHPQNQPELAKLRPIAYTAADGTFEFTTFEKGDGAPAGEYTVTVEWRRPAREEDELPPANSLPHRYSQPDSTPLRLQINQGTNELPALELKR